MSIFENQFMERIWPADINETERSTNNQLTDRSDGGNANVFDIYISISI